ncbi:uncharacterized protein LOC120328034 isoform X1 [Styela clava]
MVGKLVLFCALFTAVNVKDTHACGEKDNHWEPQDIPTRALQTRIIVYAVPLSLPSVSLAENVVSIKKSSAADDNALNKAEFSLICILKYERYRGEKYKLQNPQGGDQERFNVTNTNLSDTYCGDIIPETGKPYFLFLLVNQNTTSEKKFLLDFVNKQDAVFEDTLDNRVALEDHILESGCQLPDIQIDFRSEIDASMFLDINEMELENLKKQNDDPEVVEDVPTEQSAAEKLPFSELISTRIMPGSISQSVDFRHDYLLTEPQTTTKNLYLTTNSSPKLQISAILRLFVFCCFWKYF